MDLSWNTLRALDEEFGDSFFVMDAGRFESNFHQMRQAFRAHYPNSNLGYSCKTNYIPRLCQAVIRAGGYLEVVSGMEYELALICGATPDRIIFNGPAKRPAEIEKALLGGAIVNLDGREEVEIVEALAHSYSGRPLLVGLRCNFAVGPGFSRFGFDVEGGELAAAFARLDRTPGCDIAGLHCHFSTAARTVESFARRTEMLLEVADRHFTGRAPRFLNVGGGFFGKMPEDLGIQFGGHVPSYQEYADAVAARVRRRYPDGAGVELVAEPGMAVVSDVLTFVARVVGVKRIRGRHLAVVSGSVHDVRPSMTDKRLALRVCRSGRQASQDTIAGPMDLVGYTCLEADCLYGGYPGEIAVGDYATFENMGAYTIVMRPPFIRPSPPIVAYDDKAGRYQLVRRREQPGDVLSTYVIDAVGGDSPPGGRKSPGA